MKDEMFNEQQKEVLQFLKILDNNNVLQHVVITGSWSEYVYAQAEVLPGFELTLRTIDMDFLVKNMRRPAEPISIPALAKSEGYSIEQDRLEGTTKIFSPGGLEIEFLIGQMGSGEHSVLKTNLGVNAQALRHMDGLVRHSITVDLFGMKVQVPCPEMYVLHKMVINNSRKPEKQPKDRRSIKRLLPYIDFEKMGTLYAELTKKEKKNVLDVFEKHKAEFCEDLPLDVKLKFVDFMVGVSPKANQKETEKISKNER